MIAPNGARRSRADHPAIPISIEQTVATAAACHAAGADALHAHVRDQQGGHVLDAGLYRELIDQMAIAVPTMPVQITTEAIGIYSPSQQRQLVRDVMPSAVSVGLKEMLSDNDPDAARDFYAFAAEADIAVQHILYSSDELRFFHHCVDAGTIPAGPQQLLFVLGRYTAGQQSDPADLQSFMEALPYKDNDYAHDWAICAFGANETRCLDHAYQAGGKGRVGFENSLFHQDGTLAGDNAERVREITQLASFKARALALQSHYVP